VDTLIDPVTELSRVVGRFRRQLRRSAGRNFDAARLTESQSELLWLVGRQPGISVSAAAAELGLVANTASTLVSKLVAKGLLIRTAARPTGASDGYDWPEPPSRSSIRPERRGERYWPRCSENSTTTKSII